MAERASWSWLASLVLMLCLVLPGSAQSTSGPWTSELNRDHPLVGSIWATETSSRISEAELIELLAGSTIVLLGEVHDNADHHRLRASIIASLAERRRPGPAIVFEHIRADQQDVVNSFLTRADEPGRRDAEQLLKALEWERSGWPSAKIFEPLFREALRLRLPIFGGNTPADKIRNVGRQGLGVLPLDERAQLKLDVPLEPPLHDALVAEIAGSHCGLLPETAYANMAAAQRYRDAHLANILQSASKERGSAVLIAGNGHVRSDRGVPWHLRLRAPDSAPVVVSFVEADGCKSDAEDYFPRSPDGKPAADYIWITPQAERADPCEVMRQRFSGAKKKPDTPPGAR